MSNSNSLAAIEQNGLLADVLNGYKLYELNMWNRNGGNIGNEFVLAKNISEAKSKLKSKHTLTDTGKTYLGKIYFIKIVDFCI